MRKAQELKQKAKKFECPEPAWLEDTQIRRVAQWYYGGRGDLAERLLEENPARFHRLAGWATAENEAEPIGYKYQDSKNKQDAGHKDFARSTISRKH